MTSDTRNEIELLKRQLICLPGVQAVGETRYEGEPCLKLFFPNQKAANATLVPENDIGVKIVKSVVESIHAP